MEKDMRVDLLEKIKNVYLEIVGRNLEDAEVDLPISELGFDSLDVIDFVYQIEDNLGVKLRFDDAILTKISISDLTNSIMEVINSSSNHL